jgi:hypothetical protein
VAFNPISKVYYNIIKKGGVNKMKKFQIKVLLLSLVLGLSFFTFYSDSVFTESWENKTAFLVIATLEASETVFISINQTNPTETENQTILEQVTSATVNESPVEIHLENTTQAVKTVDMEVCDEDDYLTLSTCVTTDRTAGFLCRANESSSGCCTIRLFSMLPNLTIAEGSGPIFLLNYRVSEEAPFDECRNIETANSVVTDPSGTPLEAIASPGEYCFSAEPTVCEVAISPAEPDAVLSGDSITFSAHTAGTGCNDPCYTWDVTGESDSTIDDSGSYIAGSIGGQDVISVIDTCNGYTTATAEVNVIQDSDYDGIPDEEEADCAESNFEKFVTIDGCETVVENHLFGNGCTISDLIAQCAKDEKNHGRFVFCVTRRTLEWKKDNLLTFRNMGSIIRCAARADLP